MITEAYLLDADSFIRAKRQHYGFDFCPGYWCALLESYASKRVISIHPVKEELKRGNDDLSNWAKDVAPKDFFASVTDSNIKSIYAAVMNKIQSNRQYNAAAKERFASCADPWLIAYAKASSGVIATHEVSAPASQSKIKIPDIASLFEVNCVQPHEMLSDLQVLLKLDNSRMASR